jgi:predicted dehydrogenase
MHSRVELLRACAAHFSRMIRLGIVDFDSSHSIEFTRRFNHVGVEADQRVEGARVVAGWPGTSRMGQERIAGFAEQVRACGVELVDSPEAMLGRIDAVLVLSLAGDAHLERVRPFLEAGVPAYVDKPFACSLADAEEMVRLAEANNATLFHASALRYAAEVEAFRESAATLGGLHGAVSYGPAWRDAGNPGLFHYGIHPTAVLFALLGPGCERVWAAASEGTDVVTGAWSDGRIGTLRGGRAGSTAYGFVAFCERAVIHENVSTRYAYRNLCRKIVESFTKKMPDEPNETSLEIVRFVLAAEESGRRGGSPVRLVDVV